MKATQRTVQLPQIRLRAEMAPTSAAQRTATATFYAGATVERFDFFEGEYTLTFAMDGADLARFNAGAPVMRNHSADLEDLVGVVEKAWIAGGAAHATVRFSDRAEVETLWTDVQAGVIRNVSMEAHITELEDVTRKGGRRAYLAKKWQPTALALVPVGADPGAQIAALADRPTHPCVILTGGNMDPETDDTTTETPTPEERLAAKQEKAALIREGRIRRLASEEGFGCGDLWAKQMIESDKPWEEIVRLASLDRVRRSPQIAIGFSGDGTDYDSPGARMAMMAEGIAARAMGEEPTHAGRRYFNASLVDLAYEALSWRGHERGLDPRRHGRRIVDVALQHASSDFPLLLGNVLNKMLLPAYENAQPTFKLIAAPRDFRDFRPTRFLRGGDFPVPLEVGENGEIQHGTLSENEEQVTLATYGRIFGISRQALVNDDLGAFTRLAEAGAQRVSDFHNALFFQTCITAAAGLGPNLADGVAVYNAAHANVATSGALDVAKIGSARALMMTQTTLDGLKLNVSPKFLLVSPASLTLAEQLVSTIAPAQASNANPFAGKLTPIGDANLSGTRFYLLADPARLPQYIYGSLEGDGPLRVETRVGFEVEGLQVKVATDFGCGAIEYRAGVTGAGA